MKTCYTCKKDKNLEQFGLDKRSSDGRRGQCLECRKSQYYLNHDKMLESKRIDHVKHKKERNIKSKLVYYNNRDERKQYSIEYYNSHKQEISERSKIYRKQNKEIITNRKREYQQRKSAEKLKEQELFNSQLITVNYPNTHKICTKCQSLKEIVTNFNKKSNNNLEYRAACKTCQSNNFLVYYNNNLDKIRDKGKEYREKNSDLIKLNRKLNRQKDTYKSWSKKYKSQPHIRVADACRTRINTAIKLYNLNKTKHSIEYLGCDIDSLINHIQSKFSPGMTWDNYGEWHLDHIRPCCSFDLTKDEEVDKCFHYTNLQPLWAEDNLSKAAQDKELSIHS